MKDGKLTNLRERVATVADLLAIEEGDPTGQMTDLVPYCDRGIICRYLKYDMIPYTGNQFLVREDVAQKLVLAGRILSKIDPEYQLLVVYAYRHPEIQGRYFAKRYEELRSQYPGIREELKLRELTHTFVAYPEVAGHPTGGAVDLTILKGGRELDMGGTIADFREPERCPTFSTMVNSAQRENRGLLLSTMLDVGFAPFLGEWWHFSYGDREWAFYYGYQKARYGPIDVRTV